VQRPGQQQPGQQWQQQPSAGATNRQAKLVDVGCASDAQSATAKPAGSPAATTTGTSVQTWRILEDLSYHFLASQGPNGSWRLAKVDKKEARDCPVQRSWEHTFVAHQLFGTAADWWEMYRNSHQNVGAITWNEFKARFRIHYVPCGTLKLKKKEFSDLQQGSLTVNEYLNKFTQLSRYASDDVNTDEKKYDAFLNGLNDEIQFQLLNTDYEDLQRMVDKAINVENKLKEMERNGKWKMSFQGQSSGGNTRPQLPQPGPFFRALQMIHPPMQGQHHPFLMQRPNLSMQQPSFQMQHSQQQAPRPNMQQQHHPKF
jgi:hypothetical protein